MRIRRAAREHTFQRRAAAYRVGAARDEVKRIVIGAQFVSGLGNIGEETAQVLEPRFRQAAIVCPVEQ